MTDLEVILVQRQTVEWDQLSNEAFYLQSREFCRLWGKPQDYVWQLFQLWNQTFSVDYREIRQKLKNLSLLNFSRVNNSLFIPYQSYKNIPSRAAYYIFLDDDDWVDPQISTNLAAQLLKINNHPPLLLWRSANIGSPNQEHVVFVWGMNGRCMTNNYAVHGDWLQPFSKIEQVLQHKDAALLFDKQKSIPHLDCALTVSNKSPISSVSLDKGLNGDLTSSCLIRLVERYLKRMQVIQDSELVYMPWSKEYVLETRNIFEQVYRSRK